MIRPIGPADEALYLRLTDLFYHYPAVDHSIPQEYCRRTFAEMIRSCDYVEGYILEARPGVPAGYVLLAKMFSQEAGGMVWWVDELFVLPEFRNQGLGEAFFSWLETARPEAVKRLRLEVEPVNHGAKRLYGRRGFQPLPYEQMIREFP